MRYLIWGIIGIMMSFPTKATFPSSIGIYTEFFPPYQVEKNNGLITGFNTNLVRQIMWEADINYKIYMLPWHRAFEFSKQSPYDLLYSVARTAGREHQFQWIAPLCSLSTSFYHNGRTPLPSKITLDSLKDYVIAVPANQPSTAYLKNKGFIEDKNLIIVNSLTQGGGLMEKGRIDFIFGAESFIESMAKRLGMQQQWQKVFEVNELSKQLYLTANLDAPKDYVEKLKAAAEKQRKLSRNQPSRCH
ncbi:substrate-binding periplasmic protein [Pseudoalteromonas sp. T1lg65]|uniref:substrate-binding periplasmic protein n=1 Tax=Pseudoalteromonas sp. T1lg65 TaxID=2077101 RepID=UPI003F7A476D